MDASMQSMMRKEEKKGVLTSGHGAVDDLEATLPQEMNKAITSAEGEARGECTTTRASKARWRTHTKLASQ